MTAFDVTEEEPALAFDEGPASEPFEPWAPFAPLGRAPSPSSAPFPFGRIRLSARRRRARAAPLLPDAVPLFAWLARRFTGGEATVWTGSPLAVEPVLEELYVGCALARGRVSLVEGGNRFRPYHLGERGRAWGLDAADPLRRLRLARAFTAYQTVALVDGWAREARRHPPTLLVGHDLPALFAADEIPPEERDALLRHVARTLRTLLAELSVPLLLTLGPEGPLGFPGLAEEGPCWYDLVSFERGPSTLRARALRDDARLALVARAPGQHGLERFGGRTAEEVIAWGAPPRRTARRSRSG